MADDAAKGVITMDPEKQQWLEAAGWRVGDATAFVGLAPDEAELVEARLQLSQALHRDTGDRAQRLDNDADDN